MAVAHVPELGLLVATLDGSIHAMERPGMPKVASIADLVGELSGTHGLFDIAYDVSAGVLYASYASVGGPLTVVALTPPDFDEPDVVLIVDHLSDGHHGGDLEFSPRGELVLSIGDDASFDLTTSSPFDKARRAVLRTRQEIALDPANPNGSVVIVDPSWRDHLLDVVPAERLVAYGLRNPWRISFDQESGDLWIADVGHHWREEVDLVPAGGPAPNFGWPRMEGSYWHTRLPPGDRVTPAFEYPHGDGVCAVVGGYVYHGEEFPELVGQYVFSDFCSGRIRALRLDDGVVVGLTDVGVSLPLTTSFWQDADGELWVMAKGGVYRLASSS